MSCKEKIESFGWLDNSSNSELTVRRAFLFCFLLFCFVFCCCSYGMSECELKGQGEGVGGWVGGWPYVGQFQKSLYSLSHFGMFSLSEARADARTHSTLVRVRCRELRLLICLFFFLRAVQSSVQYPGCIKAQRVTQ